jgi:tetratricopeptide (TPR) repeat protein
MIFKFISPIQDSRNVMIITLVCFINLFSQATLAAPCQTPVASVHSVQGQVMWMSRGTANWSAVKLNDLFCPGDRIRVGKTGRTSILLNDETLIRLAENSVIQLSDHQEKGRNWLKLFDGVAHFFSRVQNHFQVNTPYVNAFIEGTEFTVAVTTDRAFVTVLEGRVAAINSYGEVKLKGGQKAVALPDKAPIVEQVVDPLDAVKWTLYYPPLIDNPSTVDPKTTQRDRLSDLQDDLIGLVQSPGTAQDPAMLVYRASLHLRVGGVEAARQDLLRALSLEPDQTDAQALLSIIATVHNQPSRALKLAQRAQENDPQSLAALLALSYAQQARFSLPEALQAAKRATQAAPESELAWSQLARLQLMFRNLGEATDAARRAVQIEPQRSQPHTTLGFVHLAGFKTDAAQQAFEKAIQLDRTAAPLPRFGLGLVKIRKGYLQEGRRQLEIAANLDPGNPLIRSYLGKAYYEEKRNNLAETQFILAKRFDENDPTAWFYNAILQQSQNRPVVALNELQSAIDLNDNRAVYRSRFLLDQDEAARDASQARVYQDLGFEQLARREAYKSLQISPQNHSAHRLLADSYNNGDSLLNTARMSELLQSQLLQPLNSNPIQPQLAVSGLGILDGAGPSDTGYAEYTPLFTRNGLNLQLNAIGGSDKTGGNDLILGGLYDRVAFSLGQFHYQTEGWRINNEQKQDIYNAFLQVALTPSSSIQFEYRHHDKESGDLDFTFEPEDVDPYENNRLSQRVSRIGLHHKLKTGSHLIASAISKDVLDIKERLNVPIYKTAEETGIYPAMVDHTYRRTNDSESQLLELQLIQPIFQYNTIIGAGYFGDQRIKLVKEFNIYHWHTPDGIDTRQIELDLTDDPVDPEFRNFYLYSHLDLPAHFNLTVGASYEEFESSYTNITQLSPKFGLTWEPSDNISLRGAYMKSLVRPDSLDQTIEPTQVAGFNQQFFVGQGTEVEQYGLGVDVKLTPTLNIGVEYTHEDLNEPLLVYVLEVEEEVVRRDVIEHELTHTYLHWTPSDRLGFRVAFENDSFTGILSPQVLKTMRLPIGVNYHWPSGFFLKTEGIYIDQEITRNGNQHDKEDFWNFDLVTGYRFPKRYGKVELIVKNLLDEKFDYYDAGYNKDEMPNPQYWPERQLFLRLSLDF